jgi:hypothetical protein
MMFETESALRAFVGERADFRVVVADGAGGAVMEYQGQGVWEKVADVSPAAWAGLLDLYDAVTWSYGIYPDSAALPDSAASLPAELAFSYEAKADAQLGLVA